MALKDTFKHLFSYFEIDDAQDDYEETAETYRMTNDTPKMRVAPTSRQQTVESRETDRRPSSTVPESNLQRLNERQQELLAGNEKEIKKTTIDIKFPKRYEDAPEIVNLLLGNASVLIDFQYMSEGQARRCLDYLNGASSVLSGNMKKVSSTMWLLTPVNVTVNIEELRSTTPASHQGHDGAFDFDMRR